MSHARLSPSGSYRWLHCPGSVRLCESAATVPDPGSVYAREGTAAHELGALCLEHDIDPRERLGTTITVDDEEFEVTDEMIEAVQVYVNAVMFTQADCSAAYRFLERKVELPPFKMVPNVRIYGTVDCWMVSEDWRSVHVFDYKHGAGVFVPVQDNSQLRIYALGVLNTHHEHTAMARDVSMHIVQPRCQRTGDTPKWRTERLSVDDLKAWSDTVLEPAVATISETDRIADATELVPYLTPGAWCRFCDCKAECPARREESLNRAQSIFGAPSSVVDKHTFEQLTRLSGKKIAEILPQLDRIESWIKDFREFARERAVAGLAIPGYKVVEKLGNRAWTDEAEAQNVLAEYNVNPFAPRKVISPAQADKKLGKDKTAIVHLYHRPKRGPILVPASDKRPPLNTKDVFGKIEQNERNENDE